jgi:hypothetical protein
MPPKRVPARFAKPVIERIIDRKLFQLLYHTQKPPRCLHTRQRRASQIRRGKSRQLRCRPLAPAPWIQVWSFAKQNSRSNCRIAAIAHPLYGGCRPRWHP